MFELNIELFTGSDPMKKMLLLTLCYLFNFTTSLVAAQDIVGFWKTVDEKTGKAQSVVAVYEYQGKYYGRLIGTYDDNDPTRMKDTMYDPKERAPGVKANPFYCGMDIIWNLEPNGQRFTNGKILDPERGKIYDAELWTKDGNLIVRGKIFFFGRNQTWPPALDNDFPAGFKKPDLTQFVPTIPQVLRGSAP